LVGSFCLSTYFAPLALAQNQYGDKKETVVYITHTGKKYHRVWCRF
jgi:hypothetical protein